MARLEEGVPDMGTPPARAPGEGRSGMLRPMPVPSGFLENRSRNASNRAFPVSPTGMWPCGTGACGPCRERPACIRTAVTRPALWTRRLALAPSCSVAARRPCGCTSPIGARSGSGAVKEFKSTGCPSGYGPGMGLSSSPSKRKEGRTRPPDPPGEPAAWYCFREAVGVA